MTTLGVMDSYIKQLDEAGIVTARLDVLVLMEHVLGIDRAQLLAHPEMEISEEQKNVLNQLVERRARHEPLAYLLGSSEFYGREFIIRPAVLEPRPESETMIDLLKKLVPKGRFADPRRAGLAPAPRPKKSSKDAALLPDSSLRWNDHKEQALHIADVGTGSGALGITAFLELHNVAVDLLEIDPAAIKVAKRNVIKFATSISVIKSDLLAQAPQSYDILLCNLPYVPDTHTINEAAMQEPKLAIFGGPDGLDLYRRLFGQIQKLVKRPLLILSESLPPQHSALAEIAAAAGYQQLTEDDFIQAFGTFTIDD